MPYVSILPTQNSITFSDSLQTKNVMVMLLIMLFFLAGHYFISLAPIDMLWGLRLVSCSVLLGLCLCGSLFLLSDTQASSSRKALALQMLIVALASGFTLMQIIRQGDVLDATGSLIPLDAIKFDMWLPAIIFVCPMLRILDMIRNNRNGEDLRRVNLAFIGGIDIHCLNHYLFGYAMILASYLIVVLSYGYHSLIMHNFTFLFFFCLAFYNTLQHKSHAVPVKNNALAMHYSESKQRVAVQVLSSLHSMDEKYRFVDKIPQYKHELERWMQQQQPYKNKDFKLIDVMQVLPLNRSYISYLFNEVYGETFFNFVMRYRIAASVHLLENHPEINIRQISDMSGFSSPSVFGRAFLKKKGVTPKQYRIGLSNGHYIEG